jgi:hypothetical protein
MDDDYREFMEAYTSALRDLPSFLEEKGTQISLASRWVAKFIQDRNLLTICLCSIMLDQGKYDFEIPREEYERLLKYSIYVRPADNEEGFKISVVFPDQDAQKFVEDS